MNEVTVKDPAPLDELMLAMDVVDTLRHRDLVLARELSAEDRDRELMVRLREIYAGQGITVSDEVLAQGVAALREDRFVYTPPEPSFGRSLAMLYVTRRRWGKWVGGAIALAAIALLSYQFVIRGPQLREIEVLPADLAAAHQSIVVLTDEPAAIEQAEALQRAGAAALERADYPAARAAVTDLEGLEARLAREYELRVVSRPGELSGVWRVPDSNAAAQNYYLIVEPVSPDGETLRLPVRNEEDGRTYDVSKWGLRVDADTFQRVARDKEEDGIIQENIVGAKARGELDPRYSVRTDGAAITDW